ncbi:MAG: ribonuclease domain-containing protein [Methyloversatilis sp.]|uniref:ribonuclease domain-containing protein n=1 Tax=Methyloversatilis sp. TaxID=2569862 RepID=UPI0027369885|nr:ribonuclease domain-containing protein [Methyloversatilis sp.]MDP3873847.1 ribonuclease domain-containing protein [Methyloversatilis sp.]
MTSGLFRRTGRSAVLALLWLLLSGFAPPDGLPEVELDRLPPEAARTLVLIQQGGPFPYSRDGVVFQNRERLLPARQRGYYREYTVRTPGLNHRGARRIVAGEGAARDVRRSGEYYYTGDHYRSFRRIKE